jgi:hypothetical protein
MREPQPAHGEKFLQIGRADARIRTADPFITSVGRMATTVVRRRFVPRGYAKSFDCERLEWAAGDIAVCAWCARRLARFEDEQPSELGAMTQWHKRTRLRVRAPVGLKRSEGSREPARLSRFCDDVGAVGQSARQLTSVTV